MGNEIREKTDSQAQKHLSLHPHIPEEALKRALGVAATSTETTVNESPEGFEHREIKVRRIQRVALATDGNSPRYAWRARVDAWGKSRSVSAESVAEIKTKIDAILDAEQ